MTGSRRMACLGALLVLGLVTVLGGAGSVEAKAGKGKSIDPALVKKLKDSARGSVTISMNEATKFASFIKAGRNGDLLPRSALSRRARPRASSSSTAASSASQMPPTSSRSDRRPSSARRTSPTRSDTTACPCSAAP